MGVSLNFKFQFRTLSSTGHVFLRLGLFCPFLPEGEEGAAAWPILGLGHWDMQLWAARFTRTATELTIFQPRKLATGSLPAFVFQPQELTFQFTCDEVAVESEVRVCVGQRVRGWPKLGEPPRGSACGHLSKLEGPGSQVQGFQDGLGLQTLQKQSLARSCLLLVQARQA